MSTPDRIGIRINLTLPPDVVVVLDRIANVTGAGRATLLREFICEALPGLGGMAQALELAQQKNTDAFTVLAKTLDKTVHDSQQLSLDIKRTRRRMRRKKSP